MGNVRPSEIMLHGTSSGERLRLWILMPQYYILVNLHRRQISDCVCIPKCIFIEFALFQKFNRKRSTGVIQPLNGLEPGLIQ